MTSGTQTINPGTYTGIAVSKTGNLILNPGVYILTGHGFSVSGTATVTENGTAGVTIYNEGASGAISVTGGSVNLPAPAGIWATGIAPGIVIFQPNANATKLTISAGTVNLNGGGIYAPAALLALSGSAQLQAPLVVGKLTISAAARDSLLMAGGATGGRQAHSAATPAVHDAALVAVLAETSAPPAGKHKGLSQVGKKKSLSSSDLAIFEE